MLLHLEIGETTLTAPHRTAGEPPSTLESRNRPFYGSPLPATSNVPFPGFRRRCALPLSVNRAFDEHTAVVYV